MASARRQTLFGVAVVIGGLACSDDPPPRLECGAGTHAVDGECVADVVCGAGTLEADGGCVPVTDSLCATGTLFDADAGACVPSAEACGDGTTLVDGVCLPDDDTLVGETTEPDEPNDVALSGVELSALAVPAVGADPTTAEGCIVPSDLDADGVLDPDRDSFELVVTSAALLDVSVDGLGGLVAGFEVTSLEPTLATDGWHRRALALRGDGAARQVYLPVAGRYALTVTDSRTLTAGAVAGATGACYYLAVARVEIPPATALTDASVEAAAGLAPSFFTLEADAGDVFSPRLTASTAEAVPALVWLVDGEYAGSHTPTDDPGAAGAELTGLEAGAAITLVADTAWSLAADAVTLTLRTGEMSRRTVASGGEDLDVEQRAGAATALAVPSVAGRLAHVLLEVAGGGPALAITVHAPDGRTISAPCGSATDAYAGCTTADFWFPTHTAGTYEVRLWDPSALDRDFTVAAELEVVTAPSLTLDTPRTASLEESRVALFRFDGDLADWLALTLDDYVGVEDVRLALYDATDEGVLGVDVAPLVAHHVLEGETRGYRTRSDASARYWVSVEDLGVRDGTERLTVTPTDRLHADLGTVDEATPFGPETYPFAVGEQRLFLLRGDLGTNVTITASPVAGENAQIRVLADDESTERLVNLEWGGAGETVDVLLESTDLAFLVEIADAAEGSLSLSVTVDDPSYDVSAGTLPFDDVCSPTTEALTGALDELTGPETLGGLEFEFFGVPVTEFVASSNGFLVFDGAYAGGPMFLAPGSDAPNAVLAPVADLLDDASVCIDATATTATVQWRGTAVDGESGTSYTADVEVVLHEGGVIDVRYGPEHTYPRTLGLGATLENGDGTRWITAPYAGLAGTSVTFAPR